MNLATLNDKELLGFADHGLDDLTSSDMERELIKRLDAFLENEADYAKLDGRYDELAVAAEEALGQFPEEDFLAGAIQRIRDLAKSCRGDNRKEAQSIADYLDDLQLTTFNATEHARKEIHDTLN